MIALRFTTNRNEDQVTSEDQVNKVQFNGLCAYDITEVFEEMKNDSWYEGYSDQELFGIIAIKQVKHDNWHAKNTKGNFVIMNADFVEYERDNQDFLGNRAVIVKLNDYISFGQIDMESEWYKCKSIELA